MTHESIVGHGDVLYANPTGRFVRACRAICVDFTKQTDQPELPDRRSFRGPTTRGRLTMAVHGGSVAFDALETPHGTRSASSEARRHTSRSRLSIFTDVRVVGVVGEDFGLGRARRLRTPSGIDTDDLERVAGARSFFWAGRYEEDMQVAHSSRHN